MNARQSPTFDTAALRFDEVNAACVPGGCGGLTVGSDGVARHPGVGMKLTFREVGDFAATHAAEECLSKAGFSVGRSERGNPRGILFGDFDIQKWRNLDRIERDRLHGTLAGDGRYAPVTISLHPNCPPHASAALTAALSNGETS